MPSCIAAPRSREANRRHGTAVARMSDKAGGDAGRTGHGRTCVTAYWRSHQQKAAAIAASKAVQAISIQSE